MPRIALLWGGVTLLLAVTTGLAIGMAAFTVSPPGLTVGGSDLAAEMPLETSLRVSPGGWAARVESVRLLETMIAADGAQRTLEVPLQTELLRAGRRPGNTELLVRPAAGTLRPDASYRLVVESSALAAGLPLGRRASVERELSFSTPTSPRPLPNAGVIPLNWEAPLPIRWTQPIEEVRYEVSPTANTRAWISADGRESYLVVENPREATTYQVTVAEARGANGVRLQQPTDYSFVTPVRPRPLQLGGSESSAEQPPVVEDGKPVVLRWNAPIERLTVGVTPAARVEWERDAADPSVTHLRLGGLKQGTTYELTVSEAVAQSGAPLAEPSSFSLATPPALSVADLETGTEAVRAPISTKPVIVFSEPIRDRRAAEAAITIEPATPGRFEWVDEQRLKFVPNRDWPYDSEITLNVRPGSNGARAVAGGYLEEEASLSFTTVPHKVIDVDVSRQVMTLIEGGRAVRTLLVGTGLPGADTPIGEFQVQYKMPSATFRGVNTATGTRYDLPNVKWVLAFMGDYTIHGAYWRQTFGRPGSNGCVSLTDADAKIVYDWAPEGTLIKIHY